MRPNQLPVDMSEKEAVEYAILLLDKHARHFECKKHSKQADAISYAKHILRNAVKTKCEGYEVIELGFLVTNERHSR